MEDILPVFQLEQH